MSEQRSDPALEIRQAAKSYGDVIALADVSLTVDGEIFGLLGANGAGKSTLYRAILDLVELDAGDIRVTGIEVRRDSLEARRRIGYLPEELELYERLTGRELLDLVAGLKGLDNAAERQSLIADFSLTERADLRISTYSLGMRKKIGLAMAVMGSPRLLLLDEPLNGLDTESMRNLRRRLEKMRERGSTIVLSSHVMSFVARICDRVAILRQGRVAVEGTPASLERRAGMDGEPFEDVFLHYLSDPAVLE